MPASQQYLAPGYDPTGNCVDTSGLLQLFTEASPVPGFGWVVVSETTPDVTAHPELVYFLWLRQSTGEVKRWTGTSWELARTLALIPDGSIGIGKLSPAGGTAGQLLVVNVGETAFEFVSLLALIANGSLSLDKLAPQPVGSFLIANGAGVLQPFGFNATLASELGFVDIPVDNLRDLSSAFAGGQVLHVAAPGGFVLPAWADELLRNGSVTIAKLAPGVGNSTKLLRVNSAGTAFELVDPADITLTVSLDTSLVQTANIAVPAVGTMTVVPHGLDHIPLGIDGRFIMGATTEHGFLQNDELDYKAPIAFYPGGASLPAFNISADDTNIYVTRATAGSGTSILAKDGTSLSAWTAANWTMRIRYY